MRSTLIMVLALLGAPAFVGAQTGPDVIVGALQSVASWGSSGSIVAYSVGTTSCNIGDEVLLWESGTPFHPVIGQQMYRLKNGQFDQVGVSWLKHGFCALSQTLCGPCQSTGCQNLGIGCSDPYTANRNGTQSTLGPRSQVNPFTGVFPYPFSAPPAAPTIGRRLQVHQDDVNPALNSGAQYFVEGHYVTQDDAAAGNANNNVSYRPVNVGSTPGSYPLSVTGSTVQELPGIFAWQAAVPGVVITDASVPGEGYMLLGYHVSDNGDGTWHYQYCVYNMNSDIAASSLVVPVPSGITLSNIEFNAPTDHSGEPHSNDAWSVTQSATAITWETDPFAVDPNANAVRWSRMYSYRFDADAPPQAGDLTIGLFKTAGSLTVPAQIPSGDFLSSPQDVTCVVNSVGVQLGWTNGTSYDTVEVTRDGSLIASLPGTATSYLDPAVPAGEHTYGVQGFDSGDPSSVIPCTLDVPQPISFTYAALPTTISGLGTTFTFEILEQNGGVYASGTAAVSFDDGGGSQPGAVTPLGGLLFEASFPAGLPCGASVLFTLSADSTSTTTYTDPATAPSDQHFAVVTDGDQTLVDDDAEVDTGWTIGDPSDTATTGIWELVNPIGTDAQPENDHSPVGTMCWVTGQGTVGGTLGANDVDGGATTLTTGAYDLSTSTAPTIGYWRWYSNDTGASPDADVFRVEVSSNGTTWFLVETVGPTGVESNGGWFYHEFVVSDFVALTSTVRVRFIASDEDSGSIIEAAIDDFSIRDVTCLDTDGGFVRGDCNDDSTFDLSDCLFLLDAIFGPSTMTCADACDINDDAGANLADVIYGLAALFEAGAAPAAPFPGCGDDLTGDSLDCDTFNSCP